MKKILLSIIALGLALTSLTAKDINTDEARYLYHNTEYILNDDGTQTARTSFALKLFTHTAMNSTYGETFIDYNPAYQKVVINSAYVVQSDGTRIEGPENSIVQYLPSGAAGSAFYNNLRTICVVHTGLDLGCTIYLDYTIESSADYLPELDVFQTLQNSSPTDLLNVTFNLPPDKSLRYVLHDAGLNGTLSGTAQSYKFTLTDVPASSKDKGTSLLCGDIPFISACTWESNVALENFISSRLDATGFPDGDAYAASVGNLFRYQALATIQKNFANEYAASKAVRKFCSDSIVPLEIPFPAAAYRGRTAGTVYNSACATDFERANLENAILTICSVPSEVGVSFRFNANDCDVLTLGAIDRFFCYAADCGALTPTLISAHPADTKWSEMSIPEADAFELVSNANLKPVVCVSAADASLASMVRESVPTDSYSFRAVINVTPEGVFCQEASALSLADSSACAPEIGDGRLVKTAGTPIVTLPGSHKGLALSNPYAAMPTLRTGSILLPYPCIYESYEYEVNIQVVSNEGYKPGKDEDPYNFAANSHQMPIAFNTRPVDIVNEAGSVSQRIITTGNGYRVTRSLKIDRQIFTAAEFPALHELLAEWYAMFN